MMDVLELATELENMPLALTQAAAYLRQMGGRCSIRKYIDKLRKSDKSKKSILDEDAGELRRDREARNSIFLTWQISFEYIHNIRQSAAELLSLMSFCDRQAIPEALVRRRHSNEDAGAHETNRDYDSNHLGDGSSDSDDSDNTSAVDDAGDDLDDVFNKDVRMLEGYSFLSTTTDPSTFEMHRLVQIATRKWLRPQGHKVSWSNGRIDNLCALFPPGCYENWSTCQIYYPHAQSAVELKPKELEAGLKWATVMYNAAWYAWTSCSANGAEKMVVVSLKARRKLLGEHADETLQSTEMLALANHQVGRLDEAEELQVKLRETTKKVLGSDHSLTLSSMSNLASTYSDQGRWDEAKELQVEVMKTTKKELGAEHLSTLACMSNLASTYRYQGRWGEAETLQVQVLETRKKAFGAEHLSTLTSMGDLASTYSNQGRWDEAEKLQVQVTEARKKVIGADHPSTLTSTETLAHILKTPR